MERAEQAQLGPHDTAILMLAAATLFGGGIAAAKAVKEVKHLKRLWGRGDEQRARDLTTVFALGAFSNLSSSGGPFEAIPKRDLTKLKEFGVRSMATAIENNDADAIVLFKEIDAQIQSLLADTSKYVGVAYLLQFHAVASLLSMPVGERGLTRAQLARLRKSKLDLGDMILLLTRADQAGRKPEEFFPRGEEALGVVEHMLHLQGISVQASLDAFRLHQSAGRILD